MYRDVFQKVKKVSFCRKNDQAPAGICFSTFAVCAGLLLSGCSVSSPEQDTLEHAITTSSTIRLDDVFPGGVDEAYVFCQYTSRKDGVALGFPADQFPSIHDDYHKWETYTGIGIKPKGKEDPFVIWFHPREILACPTGREALTRLSGTDEIKVQLQHEQVNGKRFSVRILNYT